MIHEEDEAQPSSPAPSITSKTRSQIQLIARALSTINDVKSKIQAEAKAEIACTGKFSCTIDTVKSKIQAEPLPLALVYGNSQTPTLSRICLARQGWLETSHTGQLHDRIFSWDGFPLLFGYFSYGAVWRLRSGYVCFLYYINPLLPP